MFSSRSPFRLVPAGVFLFTTSMSLGMAAAPVDDSGILVSSDGVTFGTALSGNLFDDVAFLVPTESTTADLWIRNSSASPATIRISVEKPGLGFGAFADNLTLTSLVEETGTTRTATLHELNTCNLIVSGESVPGKGTLKVQLTATLGDLDGLAGQNESAPIALHIEAADAEAGELPSPLCEEARGSAADGERNLAATGSDVVAPSIAAGILLTSGILLLVARRRRRRSIR